MRVILLSLLIELLNKDVNSYHIMFVHEIGTKSHLLQIFPMVEFSRVYQNLCAE